MVFKQTFGAFKLINCAFRKGKSSRLLAISKEAQDLRASTPTKTMDLEQEWFPWLCLWVSLSQYHNLSEEIEENVTYKALACTDLGNI